MTPPTPNHAATEESGSPKRNPPAANPIMRYFAYEHLPEHLRVVSEPICKLAIQMDNQLSPSSEKHAGLRKLLEAKDCLVRAHLSKS